MYLLEVYVTNASLNVNQTFSYWSDFVVEPFKRVSISFNKSMNMAIVISCKEITNLKEKEKECGFKIAKIESVIDDEPIISQKQYELAQYLSRTTISPFISCLNAMLPSALRTKKNIKNNRQIECLKKNNIKYFFTPRQKEVFDALYDGQDLASARKISASIIKKFIEDGVISSYLEDKKYIEDNNINKTAFKELTSEQDRVYKSVLNTDKLVSLLFGITGSGKTEVYLHLAKFYLEQNKEVLILVPEIALTPQMIQRVKERFNDVCFYHSELSDQERYEQYERVKNKEVKIVVGTRSSIFLPFENLGLIILDEEHDSSYRQDSTPCYNAVNVAKKIAFDQKAKVLLASATPSLDSFTRAQTGEYEFCTLNNRINHQLPNIELVDLTKEIKSKQSYIISRRLSDEIVNTLNNHKQAIILLNRRGYSPIIKCSDCGKTLMCSSCDVPLNFHKDENVLKCHNCGKTYPITNTCPECGSNKLIYYGFGTKKVEEELMHLFPRARIERMDKDNTSKKGAHKTILDKVETKQIDILVGTQMIAKGLDYPDVTLVGILNADAGLMHQDYNSAKTTFDLIMQASGRSGRASAPGICIIQAFNVEHYALKAVLNQDYRYFYNIEMNYRHKLSYPPYEHLIQFVASDVSDKRLQLSVDYLLTKLEKLNVKVYRPIELNKLNNLKRTRILLRSKELNKLLNEIWIIIKDYHSNKQFSKIKVEIDPLTLD